MIPNFPLANPFAVEAWFDFSCALTFVVPGDELAERLPRPLTPDLFRGRQGFVAVAVVQTRKLRPRGFPAVLGSDFVLAGYRYFVRYESAAGRKLRGLYILRSETDSARMSFLGNLFTRYRYIRSRISIVKDGADLRVEADDTGLAIRIDLADDAPVELPAGSPFGKWSEARVFSGPMPFTFSVDPDEAFVRVVEGVRSNWTPRPVRVIEHRIPFLESLGFSECIPANAFVVENIPYAWKKGVSEPVAQP